MPLTFKYSSCDRVSFNKSVPVMQWASNWGTCDAKHSFNPKNLIIKFDVQCIQYV